MIAPLCYLRHNQCLVHTSFSTGARDNETYLWTNHHSTDSNCSGCRLKNNGPDTTIMIILCKIRLISSYLVSTNLSLTASPTLMLSLSSGFTDAKFTNKVIWPPHVTCQNFCNAQKCTELNYAQYVAGPSHFSLDGPTYQLNKFPHTQKNTTYPT